MLQVLALLEWNDWSFANVQLFHCYDLDIGHPQDMVFKGIVHDTEKISRESNFGMKEHPKLPK